MTEYAVLNCLKDLKPRRVKQSAWLELISGLSHVINGLKPAYLVDTVAMNIQLALDIVTAIEHRKLCSALVVITLNDDILFANRSAFQADNFQNRIAKGWLLDTTPKDYFNLRKIPAECITRIITEISSHNNDKQSFINLNRLTSKLSVPALFGILLGYPFVYNLTNENHTVDTEVLLFQLFAGETSVAKHEAPSNSIISSFSVPVQVSKEVDVPGIVQQWLEEILEGAGRTAENIRLESRQVDAGPLIL